MLCRYVPGGVERAEKVCWVFGISFGSGLICVRSPRRMRGFLNGMYRARTIFAVLLFFCVFFVLLSCSGSVCLCNALLYYFLDV